MKETSFKVIHLETQVMGWGTVGNKREMTTWCLLDYADSIPEWLGQRSCYSMPTFTAFSFLWTCFLINICRIVKGVLSSVWHIRNAPHIRTPFRCDRPGCFALPWWIAKHYDVLRSIPSFLLSVLFTLPLLCRIRLLAPAAEKMCSVEV